MQEKDMFAGYFRKKMKIKLKFMIVNVHSITEIEMEWKLSRNGIFDEGWGKGKFRGLSLNFNKRMEKNEKFYQGFAQIEKCGRGKGVKRGFDKD